MKLHLDTNGFIIYDLSVMSGANEVRTLLALPEVLTAMMAYKRREEKSRIGSDLSDKPISAFEIFDSIHENKALRNEFQAMQNIYVFDEADRLGFDEVIATLSSIKSSLMKEQYTT